jgi:hypothetical protein
LQGQKNTTMKKGLDFPWKNLKNNEIEKKTEQLSKSYEIKKKVNKKNINQI